MKKEKARILLPNGEIIERTVSAVLRQIGPLCDGYWHRTILYKNKKHVVDEYSGRLKARYVLKGKA